MTIDGVVLVMMPYPHGMPVSPVQIINHDDASTVRDASEYRT
jgi:hypothetical protein